MYIISLSYSYTQTRNKFLSQVRYKREEKQQIWQLFIKYETFFHIFVPVLFDIYLNTLSII